MEMQQRKHPRLKYYDYSLPGCYYVTIHMERGVPVLSSVGRGLAPVGIVVHLTPLGKIARQQLFALEARYCCAKIDKYAIMPNHIHAIIRIIEDVGADEHRPTLMDMVCAYKSLTTRMCNQLSCTPGRKLFQTSFFKRFCEMKKPIRNAGGILMKTRRSG